MPSSRCLFDEDEKKMYIVHNNPSNLPTRGYAKRVYIAR
jgi:hypothetical protein